MLNQINERKLIEVQKEQVDLELNLSDALLLITKLINTYGADAKLEGFTERYSDSDQKYLHVVVKEPESDEQMNSRIENMTKYQAARDKFEREEYARLAAKFSNLKTMHIL